MPDDEELMTFALDAAIASLENRHGPPLDEARAALARLDESNVDPRDLIVAQDVFEWAGEPADRDAGGMWRRIDTSVACGSRAAPIARCAGSDTA